MAKRVPRTIKKLRGTDRPDRARRDARPSPSASRPGAPENPDPPRGAAALPLAPSFLSKAEKEQWLFLVPLCQQINPKLGAIDVPGLVELCRATVELERLRARIEKDGDMVKTSFGKGLKGHALLRHLETARAHHTSRMRAFGLYPDGRRDASGGPAPPPRGPGRGRLDKVPDGEEENYFASVKRKNGTRLNS